ncbi:histone-like nucleoid-structuring protein Lsr2 [Streptomyces sp. NPDC094049]|uniref:Lsr2 family DNA-binding protein n=1 Tax=Streptomyces sp. NPDC094049 TaxID=3154987 RepID=UPI003325D47D
MFDDFDQSAKATALALNASTGAEQDAAARTVARRARDKDDLTHLLDILGLPADETALFPFLPEPGDAPMTTNPTTASAPARSAHEVVALSMHADGASEHAIRQATGLSEHELSDLITDQARRLPTTDATLASPAIDVPVVPLPGTDPVQGLIEWAAAHLAVSVRKRAARITTDLADLTTRRDSEAVQRDAEDRVAKAKAALEKAEQDLKAVKSGPRTTTAATVAPTPTRTGASGTYSRDELTAIRTWARAAGHPVADRGLPSRTVLDAYAAAHPATPARKAS